MSERGEESFFKFRISRLSPSIGSIAQTYFLGYQISVALLILVMLKSQKRCHNQLSIDLSAIRAYFIRWNVYNFTPFLFKNLPSAFFESSSIAAYPTRSLLHRPNHLSVCSYSVRSIGQCWKWKCRSSIFAKLMEAFSKFWQLTKIAENVARTEMSAIVMNSLAIHFLSVKYNSNALSFSCRIFNAFCDGSMGVGLNRIGI